MVASIVCHLAALSVKPSGVPPAPSRPAPISLWLASERQAARPPPDPPRAPAVRPKPKRDRSRQQGDSRSSETTEAPTQALPLAQPAFVPRLLIHAGFAQPSTRPVDSGGDKAQPVVGQSFDESIREGLRQRDASLGARGVLAEMKHVLEEVVIAEQSSGALLAFSRQLVNELEATTRPPPVDDIPNDMSPAQRGSVHQPGGQGGDLFKDMKAKICLGACGQKHEVSRLETSVRVLHDLEGQVSSWQLVSTSGAPSFDSHVLSQIALLARKRWSRAPGDRIPKESIWVIRAIQYEWALAERLLDPAFKPYRLVTQCTLRSVEYR